MAASGAAATCIPVELDGGAPEAAFFIDLAGPESKADRRVIRKWRGPLSLGLDSDVIETARGAVAVLRPEVHTGPFDPFVCEILATPGEGGAHLEALDLLSRQPRLTWFFGDRGFEIIRTQQHPGSGPSRRLLCRSIRVLAAYGAGRVGRSRPVPS